MNKFEQIGVNMLLETTNKNEANRSLSRSCEICCNRGLHISCKHCAIEAAHKLIVAAMETK